MNTSWAVISESSALVPLWGCLAAEGALAKLPSGVAAIPRGWCHTGAIWANRAAGASRAPGREHSCSSRMFPWVLGCAPGWLCQAGSRTPPCPGLLQGEAEAAPSPSLCALHTPACAPASHQPSPAGSGDFSEEPKSLQAIK